LTRKTLTYFAMVGALAAPTSITFAQRETTSGVEVEKDIALLRRNLRSEKKKIIAANVPLTETEATKFWPIYDQYAAEMAKNNDALDSLIRDYAANQKTLTDAQAEDMLKRWSAVQIAVAQTRQKYIPIVGKVLPGKKSALFFQIDRRLYALMDIQIASEIPLVIQ
jgi:type IV secretory pathway ATPase VirB11/archaellum biosynthesis ATPase